MPSIVTPWELFGIESWCAAHPRTVVWIVAFCLWVSVSLMIRMWVLYRRASFIKKLIWSFVLLIPLIGWMLYAGCFPIPGYHNTPIGPSPGVIGGGGGGW